MKKLIVFVLFAGLSSMTFSQSLQEFYSHNNIGYFGYFTRIVCNSPAHTSGLNTTQWEMRQVDMYPFANIDYRYERQGLYTFNMDYKIRSVSDNIVANIRRYNPANNRIRRPLVSSWYEARAGINVYGHDDKVIWFGLEHSLFLIAVDDYVNLADQPHEFVKLVATAGPCIRIDKMLNTYFALRLRAAYDFPLIDLTGNTSLNPEAINGTVELFTSFGAFAAIDYQNFSGMQSTDQTPRNFSISRMDFNLGWRFNRF